MLLFEALVENVIHTLGQINKELYMNPTDVKVCYCVSRDLALDYVSYFSNTLKTEKTRKHL